MSDERKSVIVHSSKRSPRASSAGGGAGAGGNRKPKSGGCAKHKPCPCDKPKPCPCDKPNPETCDESKIVGEGLEALQSAIATTSVLQSLEAKLLAGFIYSGFSLLVGGPTPSQVIDTANTVFDITANAKLARNKTLTVYVATFANNAVILSALVFRLVVGPPALNPAKYAEALAITEEVVGDILDLVYDAYRARPCPKTTRHLRTVLDAGLALLMLSNLVAFITGTIVGLIAAPKGAAADGRLPPIESLDPALVVHWNKSKLLQLKNPPPPAFTSMSQYFAYLGDLHKELGIEILVKHNRSKHLKA